MPMPWMRRSEARGRLLRETPIVGVALPALVVREVHLVKQPHIGLLVECDLDDITPSEVQLIVQVVHFRFDLSSPLVRRDLTAPRRRRLNWSGWRRDFRSIDGTPSFLPLCHSCKNIYLQ